MGSLLTENEKKTFTELYEFSGKSAVLKHFGNKLTSRQINSLKQRLKVKHPEHKKININNYLNTKYGCYVLGFIWADGHINPKSNRVAIDLVREDSLEIYPIFEYLNDGWELINKKKYNRCDNLDRKPQNIIKLCNKYFKDFLIENDYHKKSGISACKIISKIKYKNYWLRGFFDGDGSLHVRKNRKNSAILSFASTYSQDWKFIEDILFNLKLKSYKIVRRKSKHGNSSIIKSESIYEIVNFLNYIYNDVSFVGLNRKYNKYLLILEFKLLRASTYERKRF
jgi:hypothetical protein